MWVYNRVMLSGDADVLNAFEKDHGLPGSPFSFQVIAPVALLPNDNEVMAAWGCASAPEILRPWDRRTPTLGYMHFRTLGGPPTRWFARLYRKYGDTYVYLRYASEATALFGEVSYAKGIRTCKEVEGDEELVEKEIASLGG